MKIINEKQVKEALRNNVTTQNWNLSEIIAEAAYDAICNGKFDFDFVAESRFPSYRVAFDCIKQSVYDCEGNEREEAQYWIRFFALTHNGADEYVYYDVYTGEENA